MNTFQYSAFRAAAAALMVLILGLQSSTPAFATRAAASVTVNPTADAYVSSESPSNNYGSATALRADGSPIVGSFLRFTVSGVGTGTVTQATLQIYANSSSSQGLTVYPVNNTSWAEDGITYNNMPAAGAAMNTSAAVSAGTWISLNVTGYVTGDGTYSFAIGTPGSTAISLAARETGGNAPRLVVTYGDSATPTSPAPTATNPAPSPTSPAPSPTPISGSSATLQAVADTYVKSDAPSSNYGTATTLRVDASPEVRSYLRFNVSNLGGQNISEARLQVYANSSSDAGIIGYRVSNNSWSESGMTWNTKPALGTYLDASGSVTSGSWVTIDVTSYVTGEGTYSFAVAGGSSTAMSFNSRQAGSNRPRLLLTLGGSTPPTPTPGPSGVAVLVGAGDIAGCSSSGDEATANLLDSIEGTIFTAGDNVYDSGTATEFENCYDPSWGRHISRTRPSPGNHDYLTANASAYYAYFGTRAGDPSKGYYSYDLGEWHIIALNSNIPVGTSSAQVAWLRADLAAHPNECVAAYWHHPLFSSGAHHGSDSDFRPLWEALYEYGADVVIVGHEHNYERFALQDPFGNADPARGIRQFVVGTGGKNHYGFDAPVANSQVRNGDTFGVLKLTLNPSSYDWEFIPEAGKTFTDSGSSPCVNP